MSAHSYYGFKGFIIITLLDKQLWHETTVLDTNNIQLCSSKYFYLILIIFKCIYLTPREDHNTECNG